MTAVELRPGSTLTGGSRTITDAELALLPAVMGAIHPLFHDEEAARRGPLGRRVLYGPALLGIAVAATEPLLHDVVIGLLGIDDVRFRSAVGVGDTVTARVTIEGVTRRPDRRGDILTVRDEVVDQNGTVVLTFGRTIMIRHGAA